MANKHRGEVEIILDKKYKLKYTTNALIELEEQLGKPAHMIDDKDLGFKGGRAMLWAGLLHEIPELTLERAGELMDFSDLKTVIEKVTEGLTLAFGSEDTEKNKVSGKNGAGKN